MRRGDNGVELRVAYQSRLDAPITRVRPQALQLAQTRAQAERVVAEIAVVSKRLVRHAVENLHDACAWVVRTRAVVRPQERRREHEIAVVDADVAREEVRVVADLGKLLAALASSRPHDHVVADPGAAQKLVEIRLDRREIVQIAPISQKVADGEACSAPEVGFPLAGQGPRRGHHDATRSRARISRVIQPKAASVARPGL
jgi:hypothetical protein